MFSESRREAKKLRGWFLPFLFIFLVMGYLSYSVSYPLIKPLAWAVLLSFIVHPFYCWLRKKITFKKSPSISAGIATGVIALVIVLPAVFGGYVAAREGIRLYDNIAPVISKMDKAGELDLSKLLPDIMAEWVNPVIQRYPGVRSLLEQGGKWIATTAVDTSKDVVGSTFTIAYYLVIIVIVCFFFIRDGHIIVDYLKDIMPLPTEERKAFFDRAQQILQAVVYGLIVTAVVQGILGGIGWWYTGLPSPIFFTVLMMFFSMIPFVGTTVIWVPGAIYLFYTGDTTNGIILFVWGMVVVGMVDNFVRPLFISGGGKAHLLVVFIGVIGGLAVWGFMGLFMGPLVLSLFIFLLDSYRRMWTSYVNPALRPPCRPDDPIEK